MTQNEFNITVVKSPVMRIYRMAMSGHPVVKNSGRMGTKDHAWRYWVELPEGYFEGVPEIREWLASANIAYQVRKQYIDFAREMDYTAFLLRWTGASTKGYTREVTLVP